MYPAGELAVLRQLLFITRVHVNKNFLTPLILTMDTYLVKALIIQYVTDYYCLN